MDDEKLDKLAEFITTNPTVRREYFKDPQVVFAWFLPRNGMWAELGVKLESMIAEDKELASSREDYFRVTRLAKCIAHNPGLRSKYLENPERVVARAIPRRGAGERLGPGVPPRIRALREELCQRVEETMDKDSRLISAREAYFEKAVFLSEALRNPQKTFDFIVWLSGLAFLIGVALLVGAFAAAILGEDTTQKAVLGGLSGAGGAATTLGAVFTISRDAVRKANGDNAQIRLILTAFATEITHYRAIPIKTAHNAADINGRIREAMCEAVKKVEEYAEPVEARKVQEQARKVPGQRGAKPAAAVTASGQQPHDPQPPSL